MIKKIIFVAGFMTLIISMLTPPVISDGVHFSVEYYRLYEPYQKAVIYWDGSTQTMILASAARADNLTDIAWIVPIISFTVPNVTAGNITVFEELVEYFKDKEGNYFFKSSLGYTDGDNVTVVEVKEIDIYDIVIVNATNASDLIDWLTANNFKVPEDAYDLIEGYVNQENCYFVINKIDLKNKFKTVLEEIENGTVLYDSAEYVEYQSVLQDLRHGMATPLKFEFTPPEPYYPLTISSLNAGYGKIEVYVLSEHPVTDKNNILKLDECKEVNQGLREKLSQYFSVDKANFVTRLVYHNMLDKLDGDAVFINFPLSQPEKPIYTYTTENIQIIISEHHIWGIAWDEMYQLIEVQFIIDDGETWNIANGAKLWSINLDELSLSDGNHELYVRVLSSGWGEAHYSKIFSVPFLTLNGEVVTEETLREHNIRMGAMLITGLVILSMIAVIVITHKISVKN